MLLKHDACPPLPRLIPSGQKGLVGTTSLKSLSLMHLRTTQPKGSGKGWPGWAKGMGCVYTSPMGSSRTVLWAKPQSRSDS